MQRQESFDARKQLENTLEAEIRQEIGDQEDLVGALKRQLNTDLQVRLDLLFNNFEKASSKRVNSQDQEKVDPTVYLGTGGVAYALQRVTKLVSDMGQSQAREQGSASAEGGIEEQKQMQVEPSEESALASAQIFERYEQVQSLNKQLLRQDTGSKFENYCASFLMAGSIGTYTIEALHAIQSMSRMPSSSQEEKLAKVQKAMGLCAFIKAKILFAAAHCLDEINEPEDEILYGTAGYLQTVLVLKQAMDTHVKPVVANEPLSDAAWIDYEQRVNEIVVQVTYQLIRQTCENEEPAAMQVIFPRYKRRGGSLYLGGAHGTLGVLYMVSMACLMLTQIITNKPSVVPILKQTCENLLAEQVEDGGFPTKKTEPDAPSRILNHWCHGAPGAIGPLLATTELLIKLAMVYNDESLADLARRVYRSATLSAQSTWKNGLVLKGNSLCHGIAGNGLLLHTFARWHVNQSSETGVFLGLAEGELSQITQQYQSRALMYARAMSMQSVQEATENYQDRQRMVVGTPDHPWSLMEGLCGEICVLAELLNPNDLKEARFPAYDALF